MIWLELITVMACGALNAWGGYSWHNARRFIMPVLLAVTISFVLHSWLLGFLILPVIGTLCLGYFRLGNFGRGLWLFLQAVVIGLGLFLTGHLTWYFYLLYAVGAGILGGSLVSVYQPIGDVIEGCWLGLIVLFIK